ncbi:hypothetical protein HRR83_000577 [Exophiala dermatitidis]|uniref:Chromosome transmission fidelity protein 8 n=2 Tax=Exophiala dermatitidis TaxID=5970 RepID=H6CA00_EXODN|nr:chromosome transmission fidelity protein 8 [Exophiala dermatitidis NIH/UT8656]KAJ4524938.1 hypothetical protein HRR75_000529 [Exophiala dermatitidis]EHY60811.1 chromosome transmission fidelity protein 8 [Exophiala dermatitidis NIH/UT8656]KAJ4527824.1 hypothetical protein HRR74_000579 [Exophiala dermatitidis]KAJ4528459.1 hypothetical protein HRR73_001082 [Exophiala dermatitidis]KAJ4531421.1 hypothetical protein HRR76_009077 [Exophiala dermatitidis]
MPAVQLFATSASQSNTDSTTPNPLPPILHTPSGLAIVEIQGTIYGPFQQSLEEQRESYESNINNVNVTKTTSIGRLEFPLYNPQDDPGNGDGKWMKKVYLYVGKHQRLTGEIKKLAKPLAVIKKATSEDGLVNDDVNSSSSPRRSLSSAEDLEIVDIVKYKLLFSARPEPVGE